MIFKQELVKLILEGKKTQTRRLNRGVYQIGKSYAIQECRTCKGIEGYRIVMDKICKRESFDGALRIFPSDALAEGGYTPAEFEMLFRKLYPKWDERKGRWAFEFHVISYLHKKTKKGRIKNEKG